MTATEPEGSTVLAQVAAAVDLQEGEAGVRDVIRAIHVAEPAPTREVSRRTGLPVPVVAAVAGELRARGILTDGRPSRLTERGRALVHELGGGTPLDPDCAVCGGSGIEIPDALQPAVGRLEELMSLAPRADPALDQSHCTAATKVRRILYAIRAGALPASSLMLLGDDDLVSVALAVVGETLGGPLVQRLTVIDVAPDLIEVLRNEAVGAAPEADFVVHDLREPLPGDLRSDADVVMTDPPYTTEGARLFLSRAAEVLRPGPGRDVFFSFGPKGPDETLAAQREIVALGFAVVDVRRGFNEYVGSGTLGGLGTMHHLVSTADAAPSVVEAYAGPLYTGDRRTAPRAFRCRGCGATHQVGPGARWRSIADLKAEGCPSCGGTTFRPMQLAGRARRPR